MKFFCLTLLLLLITINYSKDPLCASYNQHGKCIKCVDHLVLKNYTCVKTIIISHPNATHITTNKNHSEVKLSKNTTQKINLHNETNITKTSTQTKKVTPVSEIKVVLPEKKQHLNPTASLNPPVPEKILTTQIKTSTIQDHPKVTSNSNIKQTIDQKTSKQKNSTENSTDHTISNPNPIQSDQNTFFINPDGNCLNYSRTLRTCLKCSFGYVVINSTCNSVNPNCKTWNDIGQCLTCYGGSIVYHRDCVISTAYASNPGSLNYYRDPNCGQVQILTGKCLQCAQRYFFSANKTCSPVNPLCNLWNSSNGYCTKCYSGYTLKNQTCQLVQALKIPTPPVIIHEKENIHKIEKQAVIIPISKKNEDASKSNIKEVMPEKKNIKIQSKQTHYENTDPYCINNDINGKCLECAERFYINKDICTMVDPACLHYNHVNGICNVCLENYSIRGKRCISVVTVKSEKLKQPTKKIQSNDPFCFASKDNGDCTECFPRFYVEKGVCTIVDAACEDYDQKTGICKKCIDSYKPNGKKCQQIIIYKQTTSQVSNVAKNAVNPIGKCLAFDQKNSKNCIKCEKQYTLFQHKCQIEVLNPPSDKNCKILIGTHCTNCYSGYFSKNGVCQLANPQCNTYDNFGGCTSCFPGYMLQNSDCVAPVINLSNGSFIQIDNKQQKIKPTEHKNPPHPTTIVHSKSTATTSSIKQTTSHKLITKVPLHTTGSVHSSTNKVSSSQSSNH